MSSPLIFLVLPLINWGSFREIREFFPFWANGEFLLGTFLHFMLFEFLLLLAGCAVLGLMLGYILVGGEVLGDEMWKHVVV